MINASFRVVSVIAIIVWGIYRGVLYKKNKGINLLRESILLLFLIYFLMLLNLTVFKSYTISFSNPLESYAYKHYGIFGIINLIPLKETINTLTDGITPVINPIRNIYGNILVFMPLGFIIPLLFDRYDKLSKIFILGLVSSTSIEAVQLFVGGNVSDIDDIIFNTTGAILGLLCYKLFKKIIVKTNMNEWLDKIKDYSTEKIFNKSIKVIASIVVLVLGVYVYCIYDQTGSDKLSNEELAQSVFKENTGEIVDIKDAGDKKFYLIKNEFGLNIEALEKYSKNRYIKSYNGYEYYQGNQNGYTVSIDENFDEGNYKINVLVFGKNSNADSIVINLNGNEHKMKLEDKDYFLALYPDFIEVEEEVMNDIYEGKNSELFEVKFLDKDNKEVKDMKLIKE